MADSMQVSHQDQQPVKSQDSEVPPCRVPTIEPLSTTNIIRNEYLEKILFILRDGTGPPAPWAQGNAFLLLLVGR
jgi:hypothetical protein